MVEQKENISSLEARKRRLIYRATHRGTFEADLIIGQFAMMNVPSMTIIEIEDFEKIMELADTDLMLWLTGFEPYPKKIESPVFLSLYHFAQQNKPNKH
ncbi:succinate dehydrogenase assembly factor 2 [Commensalibacter sp. M0357]|uniref:FAD assembly factor SdhE n=1 Tax=Commensalibacter TaxID=1079922 RepID=UPI0012D94BBA|nr:MULTISPECIES: succinate dehydrogenase assembly factor 2 [Commensalibacter]MBI0074383.1 succinate dehydrogenase assembly factor 2 [Commensalibacter sp. M0357]MBI0084224.1 succinate dehydrogenase assembly factor 2 [Commensalibacter sp. M0355]MUG78023.1 succinate dehydrogenase assembly factor 2 [Commensalibacter melissae]